MMTCMTRAGRNPPRQAAPTVIDGEDALAVSIEEYGNTVECTFFPYDADDDALVTTWMTATDEAFVDLNEWR